MEFLCVEPDGHVNLTKMGDIDLVADELLECFADYIYTVCEVSPVEIEELGFKSIDFQPGDIVHSNMYPERKYIIGENGYFDVKAGRVYLMQKLTSIKTIFPSNKFYKGKVNR